MQGRPTRDWILRYAGTIYGWLFLAVVIGIVGVLMLVTLVGALVWPGMKERFSDAVHRLMGFFVNRAGCMDIQVEGLEQRRAGARVVVANHQSWLDPLVLISLEPRLGGPARRYMLRVPIFGAIMKYVGFYPGEVGELPSFEETAHGVERARQRSGGLLFFPEGTRSSDGVLGEFYRGAFRTAYDHDLPIQPVVIDGLERILPRHSPVLARPGLQPVRVRYLAPIDPPFGEGLRRDAVRALTDRVRAVMLEEREKMRSEWTDED